MVKLHLIALLATSLGCGPLKAVVTAAAPGVIQCLRDPAAEREASRALSSDNPDKRLDELEGKSGLSRVTCALWEIIRSLGAAVQSGEMSVAQPPEGVARRPVDQPKLDAATRWLRARKQPTVPPESQTKGPSCQHCREVFPFS